MLKMWNMWLFLPHLAGHPGNFSSPHGIISFGSMPSPNLPLAFGLPGFLGISFTVFIVSLQKQSHLASEHKLESLVSRESSFSYSIICCFVLLFFTWLLGNLVFPKSPKLGQGNNVSGGWTVPYNRVAIRRSCCF